MEAEEGDSCANCDWELYPISVWEIHGKSESYHHSWSNNNNKDNNNNSNNNKMIKIFYWLQS